MIKSKIKSTSKSRSNQQATDLPTGKASHKPHTIPTLCALLFALCLLTFTSTTTATIRYVSHTGSSTPPYTSWETAADSIQKAIDICEPGDTVLVANGVYIEQINVNTPLTLLGISMDSVIINGANAQPLAIVDFTVNGTIENFTIIGNGTSASAGIHTFNANITIRNCRVKNVKYGIVINWSTSLIENCIIINCKERNIRDECPPDTCHSVYRNNIVISNNASPAVHFPFGGYPTFINNIVLEEGGTLRGVDIQYNKGAVVKNNLISGYYGDNLRAGQILSDRAYFENNISLNSLAAYSSSTAHKTVMRNNIAKDVFRGVQTSNGTIIPDYNLFWDAEVLVFGSALLGDSNIVADPMFVKDTVPTSGGNYDFHLQAYSPAIDKGDPNILDIDGSRSDIGMYGGPFGESYKYIDLAPRPPRILSAVVDSNQVLVKWNRNTEADTSYYNVYRDTVANFTIDSTKLIASQPDTFYIQYSPYQSSRYVYKITCVDNRGNESLPSEELVINITSLTMNDYPMTINDYLLYQNYPNPFNPSTTIAYKLKERAYVKLMVYDIKGELISVLVNKEQESGYHEVEFNVGNGLPSVPNSLASGIYLYRIEIIGEGKIPVYTEMKKMLFVK